MTYFDAIVLGILQGLTEFLPVSSSGHLVLTQAILGIKQPGVSFELILHLGTLLAVLLYFRTKILLLIRSLFNSSMITERKIIWYLIIGTIPAGIVGVLLDDFFEQAFSNPLMTSFMLLVTGGILLSIRLVKTGSKPVTLFSGLIMGIGQAIAIMPGISRSGSSIVAGILVGVKPGEAAEFSFLLAIPAILGAVVLKSKEFLALDTVLAGQYLVGMLCSFAFGLAAVSVLLSVIRKGKLDYFAYYCFAIGLMGIYLFL